MENTIIKEEKKQDGRKVSVITLKKELDEFRENQNAKTDKILGILETIVNKEGVKKPIDNSDLLETPKVKVEEEIQSLTGKQRELFERYFDPNDGFKAWYNLNENIFTIEVPMTLSNMIDAQKILYKQDLRSKKVDQNNILGSIDQWCKLVCQNLNYDKRIKLK